MWDLLLVTLAKLVSAVAQPILRWRARTEAPRQRKRIAAMATTPIAAVVAGARVRIAGVVEELTSRGGAFFVRDGAGARALVQPASAAGGWSAHADGAGSGTLAAGDRVDVGGVARAADRAIDRELDAHADTRLVFAGSEAHPLFIIRR
ncbi:MAG: hypothetical protein ACXVAN_04185 [Polyangia bacterium]